MSFWDHLEELRWVILRSIIALVVFAIIGFAFMPFIFDQIIMAPTSSDFYLYKYLCKLSTYTSLMPDFCDDNFHVNIINYQLASQFMRHMTSSLWLAVIFTCPYLLFEAWRFISPALYENEKRNIRWIFIFGAIMFIIGCIVGYSIVFPMTLRFLASYELSSTIENHISLDSYMDNFVMLVFIMGLVFELPLISWLLSKFGLLTKSFFKTYRRYAIVILLIAAAIITPSGDPFTLMVVFLPLYLLYEVSALFVKSEAKEEEEEEENSTEIPVNAD